ncbi:MAG: hypothetical protein HQL31_10360 [Planctomycetes bacterium]|nr:hypothetical protein [Planctomycetota bacterium]
MKTLRIYADTSVFGGCFDEEFEQESQKLFDEIRSGRFILVISETVVEELQKAPENVQDVLKSLPIECIEAVVESDKIAELRDAYIDAGVVGHASLQDAEHIATASVAEVDLIVSWNFRHIVHFDKIHGYHGVNLLKGYSQIGIFSPKEVINYEE